MPASLRTRVVVLVAAVLLGCSLLSGVFVVQLGRDAIGEEIAASMTLARSLAEALVRRVEPPAQRSELARAVDALSTLRHVRIAYRPQTADDWSGYIATLETPSAEVPRWFERLLLPASLPPHVILRVPAPPYGMLILAPVAHDELLEKWREARILLGFLALTTLMVCGLTWFAVGRGLRPLSALDAALQRLQDGDLDARVHGPAVREIAALNSRFNAMADSLHGTTAENRRLARDLVELQSNERQALAHELHDEMSPKLFKLRVDLHGALAALPVESAPRRKLESAQQLVEQLQQWVRRLLKDLHPMVLDELGLATAMQELIEDWRRRLPAVSWRCHYAAGDVLLDTTTATNLYRIAEEALVNAARHATGATAVELRLEMVTGDDASLAVQLVVDDDGAGRAETFKAHLGLRGMRNRARALGGDCRFESRTPRGVRVYVVVPAVCAPPAAAETSAEAASH
ncbi:MAG TPA: histidine kinase [Gammaproteobacteria bacterium]|nr:histidine kinase [Gammaproteobacteria bacterium]